MILPVRPRPQLSTKNQVVTDTIFWPGDNPVRANVVTKE
jgi:hypothetical protein